MSSETYKSSRQTAARIGVPEAWLKREAREGRVPFLRAGRRLLFDPDAVEQALAERAAQQLQAQEAAHA